MVLIFDFQNFEVQTLKTKRGNMYSLGEEGSEIQSFSVVCADFS